MVNPTGSICREQSPERFQHSTQVGERVVSGCSDSEFLNISLTLVGVKSWTSLVNMYMCVHIPFCSHIHRELQNRSRIDPESLDLVKDKSLGDSGSGGLAFNNNLLLAAKFKSNFRFP